jgi:hypothetical protein
VVDRIHDSVYPDYIETETKGIPTMATMTLNIDQAAQMKAKEAFDGEYQKLIAQGVSAKTAYSIASSKGAAAYEKNSKTAF